MQLDNPSGIIKAFKKGYELEKTYWTYRSLYLSSAKQSPGETAAALATRVEDLVAQCQWLDGEKEGRCKDLYYHITEHFDAKWYILNETAREGGNLTWDKLVEEAKCQECVGKEYARFWRENSGGSTPSYGDPALATDAISRGTRSPNREHGHHLEAKEANPSSVNSVANTTAVRVRRELVQHGARSVAFATVGTTTRWSAGRLPRYKEQEVLNQSRGKA